MKYLLLISCLISFTAGAQKKLNIPDTNEFVKYLTTRQRAIVEKLYGLALTGKVRAYKTDSFHTTYSLKDLARRGATEIAHWIQTDPNDPAGGYDSIAITPFSVKDVYNIWFFRRANLNEEKPQINKTFEGMALVYAPLYSGIGISPHPLFWISHADLKATLTKVEMEFLEKIYYYGNNSNQVEDFLNTCVHHPDPFKWLNHSAGICIIADRLLYLKIASMLSFSNFYVSDQIYSQNPLTLKKPRIYDEQKKKLISLDDFNQDYTQYKEYLDDSLSIAIVTFQSQLDQIEAISFYENTKKLLKYHLVFISIAKDNPTYRFSINIDPLYKPIGNILRFYEDYIRWKGL